MGWGRKKQTNKMNRRRSQAKKKDKLKALIAKSKAAK